MFLCILHIYSFTQSQLASLQQGGTLIAAGEAETLAKVIKADDTKKKHLKESQIIRARKQSCMQESI